MNLLSDHHAIVTGGSRGIGAAIADKLDQLGARITVMGRSLEPLEKKRAELAKAQAITVDVTDQESVEDAFADARQKFGPVTILVNNAGAAHSGPFSRMDMTDWQSMLDINLSGVFDCTRRVFDDMKEVNWGRIINITSTAGLKGYPYVTAYCAAKHGVIGLTRALALEAARTGITVNAICPGYTNTEMLAGALDNIIDKTSMSHEEAEDQLKELNPQHRFIEPEEVAATVAWLCLPGSESITGQSIAVAGGEIM
jgi:NAD(P)-dependent dehydrogenase (short-subunit alcohol dehydrogenase family)